MWFASGNRDEEVFGNPYDFDVTREPNDHVTFGKGSPHFCMGNNLARMEIRLMFETLLPRLKSHRAGRRGQAGAQQLRQRHQEDARPGHPPLAPARPSLAPAVPAVAPRPARCSLGDGGCAGNVRCQPSPRDARDLTATEARQLRELLGRVATSAAGGGPGVSAWTGADTPAAGSLVGGC